MSPRLAASALSEMDMPRAIYYCSFRGEATRFNHTHIRQLYGENSFCQISSFELISKALGFFAVSIKVLVRTKMKIIENRNLSKYI